MISTGIYSIFIQIVFLECFYWIGHSWSHVISHLFFLRMWDLRDGECTGTSLCSRRLEFVCTVLNVQRERERLRKIWIIGAMIEFMLVCVYYIIVSNACKVATSFSFINFLCLVVIYRFGFETFDLRVFLVLREQERDWEKLKWAL